MPEPISARMEQFVLMVLAVAGIAGFGAAYGQPPAWIFWLPCLLSIFWRIERLPKGVCTAARWAAYLVDTFTVVLGLILNGIGAAFTFGIMSSPETMARLTLIAGYGLCFFASLFLLGPKVWPRASTFFPAAIGLMVVDCFNPLAKIRPIVMGGGAAAFAYLALPVVARGLRRVPWTQWARLAVFAGISASAATAAIIVLPLLQAQVEQTTFQIFMSMGQGYSGLSTTARLGDLETLKLSRSVALRVWSTRAQDLRARAYSRFDGRTWTANPGATAPLRAVASPDLPMSKAREWLESVPGNFYLVGAAGRTSDPGVVVTRIVPTASTDNLMVSPGDKLLVKGELSSVKVDAQQNLQPPTGGAMGTYAVVNRAGEIVQRGAAPPKEIEDALQVPADIDPRFRELAARLSEGAAKSEERIQRTLALVSRECHYSLELGKFRSKQPVAEFFFEKKRGYCQYFASAAALLLRLQGVPTRYVSGFHVTEDNRTGDHYVIRDLDAHAWIECYLPGRGWVAADPTPAAEYEALHAGIGRGWPESAAEWVKAKGSELLLYVRHNDWRSGLRWAWGQMKATGRLVFRPQTGGLLVLAAAAAFLLRRLRKRMPKPLATVVPKARPVGVETAPELALLLRGADAYWAVIGHERPPHRGPREHLDSIPPSRLAPEQRRVSERVVESFYRASFGGLALGPEEIGELRREVEALAGQSKGSPGV